MIFDTLTNIDNYCKEGDEIYKAVMFIVDFDHSLPDGKYPIDDDDIYALVQSLETAPAGIRLFERHQHHIDVQAVLHGCERHDVALIANETIAVDPDNGGAGDALFFEAPENYSTINMKPGMFVVYATTDGHRPGSAIGKPQDIRKVCVKIRMK